MPAPGASQGGSRVGVKGTLDLLPSHATDAICYKCLCNLALIQPTSGDFVDIPSVNCNILSTKDLGVFYFSMKHRPRVRPSPSSVTCHDSSDHVKEEGLSKEKASQN